MEAIFQGHRVRQEKFDHSRNALINYVRDGKLGIDVPEDLMSLIVSCLPEYYINKENEKLIKQVEQTLNKAQQSQLYLNETSL